MSLQNPPEDPLWLYNAYRGALSKDSPTAGHVEMALEYYQKLYDPKQPEKFAVFDEEWVKLVPHAFNTNTDKAMEEFILSFYREGVALAHVFDSDAVREKMTPNQIAEIDSLGIKIDDSWDLHKIIRDRVHANSKYDEIAGRMHAVDALEAIRHQAFLVYARDTGMMGEQEFEKGLAVLTKKLDEKGFNGIHRMVEADPSLKEAFASDNRLMLAETQLHSKIEGREEVDGVFPRHKIERGQYYTKMREHIRNTPRKEPLLIEMMAGRDYKEAYNAHNLTMKKYANSARRDTELNRPAQELIDTARRRGEHDTHEDALAAYRILRINYGLGGKHEGIQAWREQAQGNTTDTDKALGDPKLLSGADPAAPDKAQKKTGGNGQGTDGGVPPGGITGGGDKTRRTPSSRASSSSYSSPSPNSQGTEGAGEDVVIGQVVATAVAGAVVADGVRRLLAPGDNGGNETKGKDKPQGHNRFWQALEVAAGIAGLALVWTNREFFQQALGKSRS